MGSSKLKTKLQPHQERAVQRFARPDQPGLVLAHEVGSGKTLTSLAAQAKLGVPADVVVPASLRANYQKEIGKHLEGSPDVRIHSIQGVARGATSLERPLLVVDEAHWARNPSSLSAKALGRSKATKRLLMTASPLYNHPADMSPLVNIAAGQKVLPESHSEFKKKYISERKISPGILGRLRGVKPGVVSEISPEGRKALSGAISSYVDFHPASSEGFPSKSEETIKVPMTKRQQHIHDAALNKAPAWVRWKVEHGLPPSKREAGLMNNFMSTTRQVSNSTTGFHTEGEPEHPKIDTAFGHLQSHLKSSPRSKAVVYSNFLRTGIEPYKRKLEAAGIPYGEFSGKIKPKDRKALINDYNEGKKKVLLVSKAGAEGLDLKGTRLIQIMEPHWNEENPRQVIGRGVRYQSHAHLPTKERHVHVQRFLSTRTPNTILQKMNVVKPGLSSDEYLHARAAEKDTVNRQFRGLLESSGS